MRSDGAAVPIMQQPRYRREGPDTCLCACPVLASFSLLHLVRTPWTPCTHRPSQLEWQGLRRCRRCNPNHLWCLCSYQNTRCARSDTRSWLKLSGTNDWNPLFLSACNGQTAQETPKTLSKEWQEATNEYAKEQKMDPCVYCHLRMPSRLGWADHTITSRITGSLVLPDRTARARLTSARLLQEHTTPSSPLCVTLTFFPYRESHRRRWSSLPARACISSNRADAQDSGSELGEDNRRRVSASRFCGIATWQVFGP